MRIPHPGVEPQRDAECLGGALGFRGPRRCIAARSHFALSEVQDPHAMTGLRGLGECAAAGELDVVAMRRNRQQVDCLTVRPSDRPTVIHTAAPPPDPVLPLERQERCRTPARPGSMWRGQSPPAPPGPDGLKRAAPSATPPRPPPVWCPGSPPTAPTSRPSP